MYRRRRQVNKEIAFSFDSFLDLVANVVGIILRLILVAWVGAKTYTGVFTPTDSDAPPEPPEPAAVRLPEEKLSTDPEKAALEQARRQLAEARAALLEHLRQQGELRAGRQKLEDVLAEGAVKAEQIQKSGAALEERRQRARSEQAKVELSLAEIRRRGEELSKDIAALEKQPGVKNVLRYQTPVARTVQSDELHFECKAGRVSFLDVEAFLREIKDGIHAKGGVLKTTWQVDDETSPVGAFRLQYTVARERGLIESVTSTATPDEQSTFRYGLMGWTAVPVQEVRGEPAGAALADNSEFRRIIDHLDAMHAAVTFWVYPDSFPLYRQLRDYCVRRELLVSGRPLPDGIPISSSRHGTVSRGQ
jgi:hypothetical protein